MEALKDKTARFAKEITIRRVYSPSADRIGAIHGEHGETGLTTLEIDGEQFPWYVMEAPTAQAPSRSQLATLVVEIPAERIVFDDPPLTPHPEAEQETG